jgi:DNA-binding CsgD family transcriptional regulator
MVIKDIQEDLVRLFLRLNGYFATGLIIHSPILGDNKTELDIIGVRFPFHSQVDRTVECCTYLQIPDNTIDIIIGEVKSGEQRLQFNPGLRQDRATIEKLIDWIGAVEPAEKNRVIDEVAIAMIPQEKNTPDRFREIRTTNSVGAISIRPIVFSLDRDRPGKNQPRFVFGQLILDYIWECFRPQDIRSTCSTIYDFQMWGHSLMPIVEYFKNESKNNAGNMEEYYRHFGFNEVKEVRLSKKEIEIVKLICDQNSVEEIAQQLNLSVKKIENEQRVIQEKLGVKSEAGIVIFAIKNNIFKI